jgi:hypothetical protein
MKSDEVYILELAVRKLTEQLNEVLEDCTGEGGVIKAPSKKIYMKARSCLPAGCAMSLTKQKKEKE